MPQTRNTKCSATGEWLNKQIHPYQGEECSDKKKWIIDRCIKQQFGGISRELH